MTYCFRIEKVEKYFFPSNLFPHFGQEIQLDPENDAVQCTANSFISGKSRILCTHPNEKKKLSLFCVEHANYIMPAITSSKVVCLVHGQ